MAILTSRIEMITKTSEIVGHKSGLALTRDELTRLIPAAHRKMWRGPDEGILRIRSEEFESLIASLLYEVGNIPTPVAAPPVAALSTRYRNDEGDLEILYEVVTIWIENWEEVLKAAEESEGKSIDPTPFFDEAERRFGLRGVQIAIEFVEELNLAAHKSPWTNIRRVEWVDLAQLEDLFRSESLETFYGSFLDPRFIDYLAKNASDVHDMNWRKFEGLTCEFFERSGFYVEIGEGRDDGGVDARIWPKEADKTLPPTILVQCKRQKEKVGKVVVKALWADMLDEDAKSGLIVTTSSLSPGAEKVCTARGYPIRQADHETLRAWVQAMRTPSAGIFLGA